jgi:M6 family metalloprotease-like protein
VIGKDFRSARCFGSFALLGALSTGLALIPAAHVVRPAPRLGSSASNSRTALLAPPPRRSKPRALFSASGQRKFMLHTRSTEPAAPCSPSLVGTPGVDMNEGTLESRLPLHASGTLRAVMLFVDFPDRPAVESSTRLSRSFARPAARWLAEVSYHRAALAVTPVQRWYRLSRESRAYGLADGLSFEEQRALIAEAVASADHDVDFAPYDIVYVVLSRGSSLERSPAFHAFPGDGVRVDGTELRYGATFGDDVRGGPRGYAAHVLVHETGHIFGLPDLYDVPHPAYWRLLRFAGGWDTMSWTETAAHLLAWHKWKLGWLEPSQLTCLQAGGRLTTTLSPLERAGGLKAIVLPTGTATAYVIEARRRIGQDARLCDEGVLVYSVDATVRSGDGPIRVRAAQRARNAELMNRCGPLYEAPFDKGAGEVARFSDAATGISMEVLGGATGGGYRVRVERR